MVASGDRYRELAVNCDDHAQKELDISIRYEWELLAGTYRRLAEQADRNAAVYTPPSELPEMRRQQQQQQQQQQAQPTLDDDERKE